MENEHPSQLNPDYGVSEIPLTSRNEDATSASLFEELLRKELGEEAFKAADQIEEENPEDVPLDTRLKSPKWEFRVHGLNELKSKLGSCEINKVPDDFDKHIESFEVWLADRNANAQKAAVEVIAAFFEKCSMEVASNLWPKILPVLFAKCISQPRLLSPSVSLMSNALAVIEKNGFQLPVDELLEKGMDKKGNAAVRGPMAKQMAAMLSCIEKLLRLFGPSAFDVPSILSRVSKYTAVSDSSVKQAAYGILQELFLWIKSIELVTSCVPDKQKVKCKHFNVMYKIFFWYPQAELDRRCGALTPEDLCPSMHYRKSSMALV